MLKSDDLLQARWTQCAAATLAVGAMMYVWMQAPSPIVPFVLAFGLMLGLIAFRQPYLACLIFIAFSYFRLHEIFPALNPYSLPLLVSVLAISVLIFHTVILRSIDMTWPIEFKILLTMAGFVFLSVIFARNRSLAFESFSVVYWKLIVMAFVTGWLARKKKDFVANSWGIVGCGTVVAIVAVSNMLEGVDVVEGGRVGIGRASSSLLGDPNDLALVLTFPLAFCVALVLHWPRLFGRILAGCSFAIIIAGILATQSRGGLAGVLCIAAVAGYRTIRSKALLFLILAMASVILFFAMGLHTRGYSGHEDNIVDDAANQRLNAWLTALNMWLANPIFGVGLSCFLDSYLFFSPSGDRTPHVAHSIWLEVLAQCGIFAFILFVWLVVRCVSSNIKTIAQLDANHAPGEVKAGAVGVLLALFGFCGAGTFLSQAFIWPLYILVGLTVGIRSFAEDWQDKQAARAS